jgi:hypothetical protein
MAFGYVGDVQFEVIEPSTYSEFLERVPAGGVHHLGFSVEDYDAATADLLGRGYRLVQRGTFGDTKFGYFGKQRRSRHHDRDPSISIRTCGACSPTSRRRRFKSCCGARVSRARAAR